MATGARELKEALLGTARQQGFDGAGVCEARPWPEMARLGSWLAARCHGGMGYLLRQARKRADPASFLPGARTVLMVARRYGAGGSPAGSGTRAAPPGLVRISDHAVGPDYHDEMLGKLRPIVDLVEGAGYLVRAFCDSEPVMEKVLAVRAGLGVQRRNSLLYLPELGSRVVLAGFMTDAPLPVAPVPEPSANPCGGCTICQERCPTGAIVGDGTINARRCLSYLTIEHGGPFPRWAPADFGGRLFGCDICQEVCPVNPAAPGSGEGLLAPAELNALGEEEFQRRFGGTAVVRLGLARLARNLERA